MQTNIFSIFTIIFYYDIIIFLILLNNILVLYNNIFELYNNILVLYNNGLMLYKTIFIYLFHACSCKRFRITYSSLALALSKLTSARNTTITATI